MTPYVKRPHQTNMKKSLLILWFAMTTLTALSWNIPGHQVSATIAYLYLRDNDPNALKKVVALMLKHPEYGSRWSADHTAISNPDDRDLFLFMVAASWPDLIKQKNNNPRRYNVDRDSHYINWPVFIVPNTPVIEPDPVDDENSMSAIEKHLKILRSNKPDSTKAMSLCWIFHLTGDMHQPLHNVGMFGPGFPADGDHGGLYFYIRKKSGASTGGLHSLWDNLITTSKKFSTVKTKAASLKSQENVAFDGGLQLDFVKWSKDFVAIAEQHVYRYKGNPIQAGSKTKGRVLPAGYMTNAAQVASKQMATAGMRLAVILSKKL